MLKKIPSLSELSAYDVNRAGQTEGIRQSLYDFQTYTAATGHTSLTFFQVPNGQSSKTVADTNMELAGSLPAPKKFLVESIEIHFFPGVLPEQIKTTLALPAFINDVYTLAKSGSLNFFIGSKTYLEEAPIGRFPAKTGLNPNSAHSIFRSQAAAADAQDQLSTSYAKFSGRPYYLDPPVLLTPTQNFKVTLTWPTAVTLPSSADGRIGIVLDGILYRLSQ